MNTDSILTEEQYKSLSRGILDAIEKRYKIIPINTLKHARYKLRQPIYVTIEMDEDYVIASLDDIEAFAHAESEFEAVNLLCEEIVKLYEDLISSDELLGSLPQKWLTYLNEMIDVK